MRRSSIIQFLLLLLLPLSVFAQKKHVKEGNNYYQQQKYKEAANAYQQALVKNPTYVPGLFNLGNALIKQKNFDASRQVLGSTAKTSTDKSVKANANYNIGNTYMHEQKWEQAVESYKQALRNNPQDEAAKYNLSYALQMLKKQQGDGGMDKNKENKDNKDNKQDKNKQDDQKQDQENKDEGKNDEKENQENDKGDQQEEQNKRPQPQPSKLSEQQAEQLLNALSQEEKKLHDKKEKGKAIKVKVEKDW